MTIGPFYHLLVPVVGKLTLAGQEFHLLIGGLDPINTISGMQARLNNLGFYAGPVDNNEGKAPLRLDHLQAPCEGRTNCLWFEGRSVSIETKAPG